MGPKGKWALTQALKVGLQRVRGYLWKGGGVRVPG